MDRLIAATLDDKYQQTAGRVYLSAMQALVRLPLDQRARDIQSGLRTAGFISGYRGSPVGGYDREVWRAEPILKDRDIHFEPAINEETAATAIWGTQQLKLFPSQNYDGVFSLWYGKGPGLDRAGDAIRHGHTAGSSPHGGVVLVAGDDHVGKSSAFGVQSEYTFVDLMMPVLAPATVEEILTFGLFGIALSRFSGSWVALKLAGTLAESSATVNLPGSMDYVHPDVAIPAGGLHLRWPDDARLQEERVKHFRLPAAQAFAAANPIDVTLHECADARVGILVAGKATADLNQALARLDLNGEALHGLGVRVRKAGFVWPLEPTGLTEFAHGLEKIIVIEEKRGLVEDQVRQLLYGAATRPDVVGKSDGAGRPLFPDSHELNDLDIANGLARELAPFDAADRLAGQIEALEKERQANVLAPVMMRTPYFCAGCPHNTSTVVPEDSLAIGGIGCHTLAAYMDRDVRTFTHMGGEGGSWIGQSRFADMNHVFQNMGDGTYNHSGSLGIRAAIAAGVNVTFKILFNDAIAMTGGQPVEGQLTVPQITQQLAADGVARIAVVSDEPEKYDGRPGLAGGATVHHRDDIDPVQRELRDIPGVTALIYDQTCAAEKRRRRKRNAFPDPARFVVINEQVCEGCGDCGLISNCSAIVPIDTALGEKRSIDLDSCNKDYSCLKGFCPSFVTVEGGTRIKQPTAAEALPEDKLPEPEVPTSDDPYGLLITGIGGTGVVTVAALLGMAAHLEGKHVSVNDVTGMAQKGGPVMSHLVFSQEPQTLGLRVPSRAADALIGGDLIVSTMPNALAWIGKETRAIINVHRTMPGGFAQNRNLVFDDTAMEDALRDRIRDTTEAFLDATSLAKSLCGDTVATNMFLLGLAWQRGLVPLSRGAIEDAIHLNGVSIANNLLAFAWGRRYAVDPEGVSEAAGRRVQSAGKMPKGLEEIVEHRAGILTNYQNAAYATRYKELVATARTAETALISDSEAFATAVARNAFKLMAYKDEYEVARLHRRREFQDAIAAGFTGKTRLHFHLAPPILNRGMPTKRSFGPWMYGVFGLLAKLKFLRGTPFDPFGRTAERRMERALIDEYEALVRDLCARLSATNHATATAIANLPDEVRGFGHVKEAAVTAYRARLTELKAELDQEGRKAA